MRCLCARIHCTWLGTCPVVDTYDMALLTNSIRDLLCAISVGDDAGLLRATAVTVGTAASGRKQHTKRAQMATYGRQQQRAETMSSSDEQGQRDSAEQTRHDAIAMTVTCTGRDNTKAHTVRRGLVLTTPARSCAAR